MTLCFRNRVSTVEMWDVGSQNTQVALRNFRSETTFLKSGFKMRDVGCQLLKVAPPKLPSWNYSPTILVVVIYFRPSRWPSIFFLMRTPQIFVDLLTSSQLSLWDSSRPSDLDLQTQSPPFVLCKNLLRKKTYRLHQLIMKLINPFCNSPDSLA